MVIAPIAGEILACHCDGGPCARKLFGARAAFLDGLGMLMRVARAVARLSAP
jgi:hypothetical protein